MRKKRNTPSKAQILALLGEGLSVVDVAYRLGYSKQAFCVLYRHMRRYGIELPGTPQDEIRRTQHLSGTQREFVVGTLLGDGSIPPLHGRFRNYYLSFSHTSKAAEYAQWKASSLAPFDRKLTPVTTGKHHALTFSTITHDDFAEFRTLFYPDGIKVVPTNISELLTPLALAVWYMDDGTYCRWHTGRGGYCSFCSEGFSAGGNMVLAAALLDRFSLVTRLQRVRSGNGVRLLFDRPTSERFAEIVRPYFHPSLLYKLP